MRLQQAAGEYVVAPVARKKRVELHRRTVIGADRDKAATVSRLGLWAACCGDDISPSNRFQRLLRSDVACGGNGARTRVSGNLELTARLKRHRSNPSSSAATYLNHGAPSTRPHLPPSHPTRALPLPALHPPRYTRPRTAAPHHTPIDTACRPEQITPSPRWICPSTSAHHRPERDSS